MEYITITGKNMTLADTTRKRIERKLQKLGRHLTTISGISAEISEQPTRAQEDRFVAQVTIDVNGPVLRGEARAGDLVSVIDQVMEVMERRVSDFKTKSGHKGRGSSLARGETAAALNAPPSKRHVNVVHQRLTPISLDEAIDRLDGDGLDHLLFLSDRGGVRLLKRDGEDLYTLVEPETD